MFGGMEGRRVGTWTPKRVLTSMIVIDDDGFLFDSRIST